tara:strand:+ start:489 stop:818 length:330 start_codon:yes stop_codon:yes gene_type:complete
MSNSKFKVGQVVSYKPATSTKRARKGGTITKIEKMYELKDENKNYYPNGVCRGELTTSKKLSKGIEVGYAYQTNSIQPEGYAMDITSIEEDNLRLSTEYNILNSYNQYV